MQTDDKYAYGVTLNIDGTLRGNIGGTISVLEYISHKENAPVINITKNAKLYSSDGTSSYAAVYANCTINETYIEGSSTLGVKSGNIKIYNATLKATGEPQEGIIK